MLGPAVFNVLRPSAFADDAPIGAAGLDLGEVWVAFAIGAPVCLAAAVRMVGPTSAPAVGGR